jgi:hypothetical protein
VVLLLMTRIEISEGDAFAPIGRSFSCGILTQGVLSPLRSESVSFVAERPWADSSLALQAVDEALFQTDCYNISFLKTAVCIIS